MVVGYQNYSCKFFKGCDFMIKDKGWIFLFCDGDNNPYYDEVDNGRRKKEYYDGSVAILEADGSFKLIKADGSATYLGADGSWGFTNSSRSGYYYQSDGSWGYKNADGSGAFYDSKKGSTFFESDRDDDCDSDDCDDYSPNLDIERLSISDVVSSCFNALAEASQYAVEKAIERKKEAEHLKQKMLYEEHKRICKDQKRKECKQRNKRIKAFLFNKKHLQLEYSISDMVGENIESVIEKIEEAGFNKYIAVPIKDIYVGSNKNVGEVEEIDINGKSDLPKGALVPYDAKILISYHEKKQLRFPYAMRQMKGRKISDLVNELTEIGFTEVNSIGLKDLTTGWINKDKTIKQVYIDDIKKIQKDMIIEYDRKITIYYHSFKKNKR